MKRGISYSIATADDDILQQAWQKIEFRFDVLLATNDVWYKVRKIFNKYWLR